MSDNRQNADELIGRTIAGRYRIISRLGAGGMGVAYRAWDEEEEVPVVIKIPKKAFLDDPKFAERFAREIRLLQGLRHPHIVPIVDVGEHEGLPYVAMRFLPGGSLSNRRLRGDDGKPRPNPTGMLHLWLPAVADALDHVHANGVIHRDVKPGNIFFDAFWGAFLGDFGIAKIVEESESFDRENTLTATNMGIGTQEYMGPEQFTPKPLLDGRTDQYALAVMVYEMLAGTRPFTGTTAHLIIEVTTQPVPPLDRQRSGLPASLVQAVHRGLAKNPGERFSTCREFAYEVLRDVPLLADEPDIARLLCPKCSNILKLPVAAAGQKGKCPKCQTQMKVADDLGALWLLDEARRQRRAAASVVDVEDIEDDQEPAETEAGIDEAALEAFKPVSSTTPIERAARKQAKKPSIGMILGGVAAAVVALAGLWIVFGGGGKKPITELTYEQKLAQAEEKVSGDPDDKAANDFLGRHWCFKQDDWKKGLPYLAKSGAIGLWNTAKKQLDLEAANPAAGAGDMVQLAMDWWTLAAQKKFVAADEAEAIKKHAAGIYTAAVDGLTDSKAIDDTNRWLDRNPEFLAMTGGKRPPKVKLATAEEILARPPIENSIGMKLKLIPPGTFMMGSMGGQADEKPVHEVRITTPFYIGVYEVTNTQWKTVMGVEPPSQWKEGDCPVERTTWNDAVEFCQKLSERPEERAAGRVYRLPTEAEWEYSCRAGTTTVWSSGDDKRKLGDYAWIVPNSGGRTHPVGGKKPNSWDIFDMHGNVYEWCSDWHGPYPDRMVTDPTGPDTGSGKVNRGGGWIGDAGYCRSAHRDGDKPLNRVNNQGFRVAMSPAESMPPEAGAFIGNDRPNNQGQDESLKPRWPSDAMVWEKNGHAYKVFKERLRWPEAKQRCEELGGHLVSIASPEERQFVHTVISAAGIPVDNRPGGDMWQEKLWAGGTDEGSEGKWRWVDGSPWEFAPWLPQQPDNDGNYLNICPHRGGGWNDDHAVGALVTGFICEWPKQSLSPETKPAPSVAESKQGSVWVADLPVTARKSHFFHNRMSWEPVGGKKYANTIHIHPEVGSGQSQLVFEIDGKYEELTGATGVMDLAKRIASPQIFRIVGDGKELWKSAPFKQTGKGEDFRVNVSGVKTLELLTDCTGSKFDAHCVWIEPQLVATREQQTASVGVPQLPTDASPQELLEFAKGLLPPKQAPKSREEMLAYTKAASRVAVEAADKVLAQAKEDEELFAIAAKLKLESLSALGRLGEKQAAADMAAFAAKLAESPVKSLAIEGKRMLIVAEAQLMFSTGKFDGAAAIVKKTAALLEADPENIQTAGLAMQLVSALEQAPAGGQVAVAAIKTFSTLFLKSSNERIRQLAKGFEGKLRLLELPGKPMEITGSLLDGSPFDQSKFTGKVMLVLFWTTWCGPCVTEISGVRKQYEKYHQLGFEVVGISLDEDKAKVEKFVADNKIPWPILFAGKGWQHPMAEFYGISGVPELVLIGRDGKVITLDTRGAKLGEKLAELFKDAR